MLGAAAGGLVGSMGQGAVGGAMVGGLGGAAIGGLSGLAQGMLGYSAGQLQQSSDRKTRRYMEKMQREAWAREDNAVQRRVADLKAAGLSPVLAAGSAASSSAPIQIRRESGAESLRGAASGVGAASSGVMKGLEVGMAREALSNQISHTKAQNDLLVAQADKARAEARYADRLLGAKADVAESDVWRRTSGDPVWLEKQRQDLQLGYRELDKREINNRILLSEEVLRGLKVDHQRAQNVLARVDANFADNAKVREARMNGYLADIELAAVLLDNAKANKDWLKESAQYNLETVKALRQWRAELPQAAMQWIRSLQGGVQLLDSLMNLGGKAILYGKGGRR